MNNSKIYKRLFKDYTSKYLISILLAAFFSIIVAGSTSSIAWLLDPAIEKILLKKLTLIFLIPLAIIIAFTAKGISLYLAKLLMIRVGEEVKKKHNMLNSFIKADTELMERTFRKIYLKFKLDVTQITRMLSGAFLVHLRMV